METASCDAYVKQRVAAYKYPQMISIVHELPKGHGEILKRESDPGCGRSSAGPPRRVTLPGGGEATLRPIVPRTASAPAGSSAGPGRATAASSARCALSDRDLDYLTRSTTASRGARRARKAGPATLSASPSSCHRTGEAEPRSWWRTTGRGAVRPPAHRRLGRRGREEGVHASARPSGRERRGAAAARLAGRVLTTRNRNEVEVERDGAAPEATGRRTVMRLLRVRRRGQAWRRSRAC